MRTALLLLGLSALLIACGPNTNTPSEPPVKGPERPVGSPNNADLPNTGAPAARDGQPPLVGVMHFLCENASGPAAVFPVLIDIGQGQSGQRQMTITLQRDGQQAALPQPFPMDASGHMQGSAGPNRADMRWEGDLRAAPPPQHAVGRGIITFGMDFSLGGQHHDSNISMCSMRWTLGPGMSAGNRPPPSPPASK